jgi:hypothetical protein
LNEKPHCERRKMSQETSSADKEKVLEEALKASLVDGKLPCAVAFQIAAKYKVGTRTIGDMANKLKIKIAKCQLGCFP